MMNGADFGRKIYFLQVKKTLYTGVVFPHMQRAGGHRLEALRPDSTWRLNYPSDLPDGASSGVWMTCAG
jgi:hypothetical protein